MIDTYNDATPMAQGRGLDCDMVAAEDRRRLETLLGFCFADNPQMWLAVRHVIIDRCSFANAAEHMGVAKMTAWREVQRAAARMRSLLMNPLGYAIMRRLCPCLPQQWRADGGEAILTPYH